MTSSETHPLHTMRPHCKKGKKSSETKCQKNEKYFYIKILKNLLNLPDRLMLLLPYMIKPLAILRHSISHNVHVCIMVSCLSSVLYEAICSEYNSSLSTVTFIIAFFLDRNDEFVRLTCMYYSTKPIKSTDQMVLKHEKMPEASVALLSTRRSILTRLVTLFWKLSY
jgi:hypothetical protein